MAQMFNGQGFQVNQQLGGTNLAMGYWGNSKQNNPINNLQNLIGNLQYTHQYKGLMDNIDPYDGRTAAQKMQQQGIYNDYTINFIDKLTAAYNAEANSMKAARQVASDFNAEAILAEAHRVRASGDPAQIQAFNNRIAKYIDEQVASGNLTPETAQKLYINYNAPLAERANIGLTNAQARQANADAHLGELAAKDVLIRQDAYEDAKALRNVRGIYVTNYNSAVDAGNALGWDLPRITAAYNIIADPTYAYTLGGVSEQIGSTPTDKLELAQKTALASNTNVKSEGEDKPSTSRTTASSGSSGTTLTTNGSRLDESRQRLEEAEQNIESTQEAVNRDKVLTPTDGTANKENLQTGDIGTTTTGEAPKDAGALKPNTASTTTGTLNNAASTTGVQTQTGSPNTGTVANGTPVNTQEQATVNKDASDLVGKKDNVTTATNASKLDETVEKQSKSEPESKFKFTQQKDGSMSIPIDDKIIYDSDSGTVYYNEAIPKTKTNVFSLQQYDNKMQDYNILFGDELADMLTAGIDSGKLYIKPSTAMEEELKKNPKLKEPLDELISEITEDYASMAKNPNDFIAMTSYILGNFSDSENQRKYHMMKYNATLDDADTADASNAVLADLADKYKIKANNDLQQTVADTITPLNNLSAKANTEGENMQVVEEVVKSNPSETAATMSATLNKVDADITNIKRDADMLDSELKAVEAYEEILRTLNENNGDYLRTLDAMSKSKNPIVAAIPNSLNTYGIVHTMPSGDKANAEKTEQSVEFIQKFTGEALTTFEDEALELMSDYSYKGMTENAAKAAVLVGGMYGTRNLANSVFNSLTSSNTMFVLNEDNMHNAASLFNSYLSTPQGATLFRTRRNSVDTLYKDIEQMKTARAALEGALTGYANLDQTLKDAGFEIRRYKEDGVNKVVINSRNAAAKNALQNNTTTMSDVRNTIYNVQTAAENYNILVNHIKATGKVASISLAQDNVKRLLRGKLSYGTGFAGNSKKKIKEADIQNAKTNAAYTVNRTGNTAAFGEQLATMLFGKPKPTVIPQSTLNSKKISEGLNQFSSRKKEETNRKKEANAGDLKTNK